MKTIFVTGTDTEVGKTFVTTKLLKSLSQKGYKTFGIKPIASGAVRDAQGVLKNEDALQIQSASSIHRSYSSVNPIVFEPAIAPHLAALQVSRPLTKAELITVIQRAIVPEADINLIEGAGGWLLPLNDSSTLADVVAELNIPTILVVGLRLGCLNHAMLTVDSIRQRGVRLLGWVGNCIDPNMQVRTQNINTLRQMLQAPLLGIVPHYQ